MPSVTPQRSLCVRGFSLIELLIVLSIVTIFAGMAVPRWIRASQHYECELAARRIAADIAMAQSLANNKSTSVTIRFNFTASTYSIAGATDLNHSQQPYFVDLTANPYRAKLGSISFSNGTDLTFDGYGVPLQGGSLVVTVADRQRTVSVDASSGRVLIQ